MPKINIKNINYIYKILNTHINLINLINLTLS